MIYLRAGVNPWLPWGVFLCLLFVFGVTKCKSDSLSRMFHFFFFICCSVILRRNKQFKSLTWLAGSGVSIFCCKKSVNWAFELWLGGLLQAEWRIKIDEPYWQTWYILVLFHGIPYGFFFLDLCWLRVLWKTRANVILVCLAIQHETSTREKIEGIWRKAN